MTERTNLELKRSRLRNEAMAKAMTALRMGPTRKRRMSGNSQFINRIGVCENHRQLLAAVDAAEAKRVGLGWANFLVMRRTHATLMKALGVDGKLVADQLGHSLDVNQNVYTQSPVESRLAAVNQLEKSLRVM